MNKKAKATSEKKRKAEESKEAKDCKTVKIKFNKMTLKKSNNYTIISEGIKSNKSEKILQLEIDSEESKELKD